MANIAISDIETTASTLKNDDYVLVSSKNTNGTFTSAKMTGEKLKNSVKPNIATSSSVGIVKPGINLNVSSDGSLNCFTSNCPMYITEFGSGTDANGNKYWYKVYNNNFCEQGGYCTNFVAGSTDYFQVLPKSYNSLDYYVVATPVRDDGDTSDVSAIVDIYKSPNNLDHLVFRTWQFHTEQVDNPIYWRADGIIIV